MKRFLFSFLSIFILISFLCSSVPVSAAEIGSTFGSVSPLFQAAFDELTSNPTISSDDLLVSSFTDNNGFHFIFSSYSRLLSYSDDILYTGQFNDTIPYESITITETSFRNFGRSWGGHSGLDQSGSLSLLSTYDFTYLYDNNVIWSNSRFFAFDFKSFRHVEWDKWGWADALNYYFSYQIVPVLPDLDGYDLNYVVKNLGIDKDGFSKWLIETGKVSELYNIFGNVADVKLNILIDFFDKYGGNSLDYVLHLPKLLSDLKLQSLSVELIKSSYNVFRSLYKEYMAFKQLKPTDVIKYMQGKMQLINPEDDTLPSLDTDSFIVNDNDNFTDSILKRILMMNYYMFNSINYNSDRVINSIDNLSFDLNTDFSPVLDAINNMAGLAVMNNDLTANLNTSLTDMSSTLNDISEDVNVNNDISDKLDTVNMSITNLSYNAGGSDGGSGGSSGSGVDAPSAPEFDFDTMREGMGSFFDFIAFVISKLPPVVFYLFSAGMAVVIYCRILGR